MITQEILKEYLKYFPDTGHFVWIKKPRRKPEGMVGTIAGSFDFNDGYRRIQFRGKSYRAHRLAFLYMEGSFPEHLVDHINGIVDDNRWSNLRRATHSENCKNVRPIKNASGYRGIFKSGNGWAARGMHNKKFQYLGQFKTAKEASDAYELWAKSIHGKFYKPQV